MDKTKKRFLTLILSFVLVIATAVALVLYSAVLNSAVANADSAYTSTVTSHNVALTKDDNNRLTAVYGNSNVTYDQVNFPSLVNPKTYVNMGATLNIDGAIDDDAYFYGIHTGLHWLYSCLNFGTGINVNEISGIKLRVYMHLYDPADGNGLYGGNGGLCVYGASQDGTSNTNLYSIKGVLVQDEWTEITINQAAAQKLVEDSDNGILTGIKLGYIYSNANYYPGVKAAYILIDTISSYTIDKYELKDGYALSVDETGKGYTVNNEKKLTAVYGSNTHDGGGPAIFGRTPTPVDAQNATDGKALQFDFHSYAISGFKGVEFYRKLDVKEVCSLTFRVYLHLYSAKFVSKYGGICIYGLSQDGTSTSEVYTINNVESSNQDKWIDLTLTQSQVQKLLEDEDKGTLSGIKVGLKSGVGDSIYTGAWTEDVHAYMMLDNVSYTTHNYGEMIAYQAAQIGVAGTVAHYHCDGCNCDFDANHDILDSVAIAPLNGVGFANLSLEGDIGLNLYAYIHEAGSATATFNGTAVAGVATELDELQGVTFFGFSFRIAPKEYNEDIVFEIADTDISKTYKLKDFIDSYKVEYETKDVKIFNLVCSLENYCAQANIYFDETARPAVDTPIDWSGADLSAYRPSLSGSESDISIAGVTLVLTGVTQINVYFRTANADNLVGVDFQVDGVDVGYIAVEGYDGLYCLSVQNIVAADLDTTYVISIGNYTVNFSALSYAYVTIQKNDNVALSNLAKALYDYSAAANAYFDAV